MRNDKGITLTILVMTILLLLIIVGLTVRKGLNNYNSSKVIQFESYMKILQKKVDIMIEERTDITNLGEPLTLEQKQSLQSMINEDENIETDTVEDIKLRYFSIEDIEEVFDVQDVPEGIIVNFSNREVISTKGVKNNEKMHYVEKGLR